MTILGGSFLDLAIIFIMGLSVFIGFLRGATREVLGIAGWVGAFCTVFYGLPLFRPLGRHYLYNPVVADVCVGGVLFILSLALFILISRGISSGVKGSLLSGLDRSLGLVFGFARGGLIICLIYMIFNLFNTSGSLPLAFHQSRLMPWVAAGAYGLKELIPAAYLPEDSPQTSPSSQQKKLLPFEEKTDPEETVRNLSILKPTSSPKKLEQLIEKHSAAEKP